jgi:hypothetical protein
MTNALQIALEINKRKSPDRERTLSQIEEHVYREMLAFHGINGLALQGRRALFKDLKLVAKAELMSDGLVVLFRNGNGRVECKDESDFDQKLGEAMAEYIL